jgi:hypothetical protein
MSNREESVMNVRRMLVRGAAGVLAAGMLAVPGQAWADSGLPGQAWTVTDLTGSASAAPAPGTASRQRPASRFGVRRRLGCAAPVLTGAGLVWVVRPGDTLSLVAACVRVTVPELAGVNGLPDPDLILAGSRLVIPA